MYTNWQEQDLDSFATIRWYRVDEVIQYLHDLRRYIIYTPGRMSSAYMPMLQKDDAQDSTIDDEQNQGATEGHGMLQQLQQQDKLQAQCLPAKCNQRFPSHEFYICEAIGEWGLKLDRLALVSSIMVNTNRLERRYPHVNTVGELEEQGMAMLHELMRMIVSRVEFVNRQQFEALYGLNWQEEQQEHEQTPPQQPSIEESSNANHVKSGEDLRQNVGTGYGSITPPFRSMSSDCSDSTVDLTSIQPQ